MPRVIGTDPQRGSVNAPIPLRTSPQSFVVRQYPDMHGRFDGRRVQVLRKRTGLRLVCMTAVTGPDARLESFG